MKWKQVAPDVQVAPADGPVRYAVVYCSVPGFTGHIAWRAVKQRATRIGGFETAMLARLACEADSKKMAIPKE